MTAPPTEPEHWMERERAARAGMPPDQLARWSGWGFVLFALVAISYGLGAAYSSGTSVLVIDITRGLEGARGSSSKARLGPYRLDPAMNPMRWILDASHAPFGSSRRGYELVLEDASGTAVSRSTGTLGNRDDEASVVITRTSLGTFEVPRAREYFVRVRGSGASMDDLRAATLQLRRNVKLIDPRIPWGFGLAAVACLVTNLLAPLFRRRAAVAEAEVEEAEDAEDTAYAEEEDESPQDERRAA